MWNPVNRGVAVDYGTKYRLEMSSVLVLTLKKNDVVILAMLQQVVIYAPNQAFRKKYTIFQRPFST